MDARAGLDQIFLEGRRRLLDRISKQVGGIGQLHMVVDCRRTVPHHLDAHRLDGLLHRHHLAARNRRMMHQRKFFEWVSTGSPLLVELFRLWKMSVAFTLPVTTSTELFGM